MGRMEEGAAPSKKRCWQVWDGPARVANELTREEASAFVAGMAWQAEKHKMSGYGCYRYAWKYA